MNQSAMQNTPFSSLAAAWQSGDSGRVSAHFHPDATWVIDGQCIAGDEIPLAVEATLSGLHGARVIVRRAFHDLREPDWWAGEWAFRANSDGATWREMEQGLLLHLRDGRIDMLRTHNDHRSIRVVQPDDPLREEAWPAEMPSQTRAMTHEEILAAQMRHVMEGWAQGNDDVVASSHGPAGLIQTSFEVVRGHAQLRAAVKAYFANYADTRIDVHRMVYDGTFLAINQTWHCTNRKTGVAAGDQDLNIGIMRDGKLYRWREYYDSRTSAQTLEQTVFGR
jgi:ketosteroid isomerase-like protein